MDKKEGFEIDYKVFKMKEVWIGLVVMEEHLA